MLDIQNLIRVADAYKAASKIEKDSTVSNRVFGDSKKLAALRAGGDITVGRFRAAMIWFRDRWPEGADLPADLIQLPQAPQEDAA
jgi:hypothetical protein